MKVPGSSLAKNPLGIISLFVFFIEAIATVSLGMVIRSNYAGHVVWFIILFPTLIVVFFFVTLWVRRECLYSPMEFRDDKSFLGLLNKVKQLETRQQAAGIDLATAELSEVIKTIDKLLSFGDVYGAVQVGRAYLKQGKYDESRQIFNYLKDKASPKSTAYFKILSNLAYSQIGEGNYKDAIEELTHVKKLRKSDFKAWHSLAMAYSYYRLGDMSNYQQWLETSKRRDEYARNIPFFKLLYPEMRDDL